MMCMYVFTEHTNSYIYMYTQVSSIVIANSTVSSELTLKILIFKILTFKILTFKILTVKKSSSELIYDHVCTLIYHIYQLIDLYIYNSQLYRDCE